MSNSTTSSGSASQSTSPPTDESYPEQLHAGKVGLGPNFHQGASMVEKVTGLAEEIHGKIKHNPELVKAGRDKRTGETKKREMLGLDDEDPFASADADGSGQKESKSQKDPHSPISPNTAQDKSSSPHEGKDDGRTKESPTTHPLPSSKAAQDKSSSYNMNNTGPPSSTENLATAHSPNSSNVLQNQLPSQNMKYTQSPLSMNEVAGTHSPMSSSAVQDHSSSCSMKTAGRSGGTEEPDRTGFRSSSDAANAPSRSMRDAKLAPRTQDSGERTSGAQVMGETETKESQSSTTSA